MMRARLLVGTSDGLHAIGARGGRAGRYFAGREVTAIAHGPGAWWAIVAGRELWRRFTGRRWRRIADIESGRAHCIAPFGAGVLIGIAEAGLLRFTRRGLERIASFDRMPGRRAWFTPWGGPPDTRSISIGPGRAIYANVHVGGIARSRDRGASWAPTLDIEADVHQVLAHPARRGVVLAASAIGLGISRDGGASWAFATEGLHAHYQRAVALAGDVVLVSTARSERGEQSAVYRRALDDGGAFTRCARGLPTWFDGNVDTGCLAASGASVAIGARDGSLYLSRDRGASWRRLRDDLPRVRCVAFVR